MNDEYFDEYLDKYFKTFDDKQPLSQSSLFISQTVLLSIISKIKFRNGNTIDLLAMINAGSRKSCIDINLVPKDCLQTL